MVICQRIIYKNNPLFLGSKSIVLTKFLEITSYFLVSRTNYFSMKVIYYLILIGDFSLLVIDDYLMMLNKYFLCVIYFNFFEILFSILLIPSKLRNIYTYVIKENIFVKSNILKVNIFLPFIPVFRNEKGIFKQNNAPCHVIRNVLDWFLKHNTELS